MVSELLVEMGRNVDCSSSWIMCLCKGLKIDTQNLRGIQWEFVTESSRKQIHFGKFKHLRIAVFHHLIQGPFCIERFVQSQEMVSKNVEFPWNVMNSENYIMFQAPMEDFPYFYIHRLTECVHPCLLIYETSC